MEEITLTRGGRKVTFKKVPDRFAVRLEHGRATSEKALEAATGAPVSPVRHVDVAPSAHMDIFAVENEDRLEETMDELRRAHESDVVSHMYTLDDVASSAVIPTGTLTLQFEPDVEPEERLAILAEHGLEIIEELSFLPHGYSVRLTKASTENPLKIAAKLQEREGIAAAEPDLGFQVAFQHVPSDPLYPQQWHLNNTGGGLGLKAGADVKAEQAWQYTLGSRDIVVCVIDDGFDLTHPDLSGPGKIVAPWDFGRNTADPSPASDDDNHGTACAGVAVAEENGIGVVGLAPRCALMPVRMSAWLTDSSVVAMFRHAMNNHADVISCSWSARSWNFPLSMSIQGILHQVATEGRRNGKGCVILFAAGNDDRPLDGEKNGRISHQGFALHPDVMAVGASNSLDQRSSYSNYGPELTLCAPSSGSPGRGIITTDRMGPAGYDQSDYTLTERFGGTSSATPLAAGLAALILSLDPDLTSAEVKQIMTETADKIGMDSDGEYVDGHSPWYGHGRINAARALEAAAGRGPQRLPQVLAMEHRVNRDIPDLGEASDTIPFPLDVEIKEIEVGVEVRHTWSGDLRIRLQPPQGSEITLYNRSGGSAPDVVHTYRSSAEPALFAGLLGKSAEGDWVLTTSDHARRDVGLLVKWELAVTY